MRGAAPGYVPAVDHPLAGRYELGPAIGAGGMARVHAATDTVLGRPVAVKLLDADAARTADPAGRERFLREARSLASFAHPNVVTLYDAGEADGLLYLVMERVAGGNLAELIARDAPIEFADAARICADVLAALQAAHDAGLVHRDVKPSNILLTTDGVAKLADFGIAKELDDLADGLTAAGMVVGTRHYLAPEQAMGADATPASDVYAVGVMLHELVTGQRPGPGPAFAAGLPAAAEPVLRRALAAEPSARFADAADMARQLGRHIETTRLLLATPAGDHRDVTEVIGRSSAPARREPSRTPTRVATAVAPPLPARPARPARRRSWWPLVLMGAVAAALLVGVALLAAGEAGRVDSVPTTPATGEAAPDPASVSPTEPSPTEPEPTDPPPTEPVPTEPDELIPGFAAPHDLADFIAELRDEREVAGKEAKKLADRLEELAERAERGHDDDSGKLDERADDLRDDVGDWVEEGKLHPSVGAVALDFVDRLLTGAER